MPETPLSVWSDRRGLSQKGREIHEASSPTTRRFPETGVIDATRRASSSSGSGSPLSKTTTGDNISSTGARRRSSASSSGLFGNLTNMKRGSQDYGERRASQTEMMTQGGLVSGWFNSTFRGIQRPAAGGQNQQGGNTKG